MVEERLDCVALIAVLESFRLLASNRQPPPYTSNDEIRRMDFIDSIESELNLLVSPHLDT